MHHADDGARPAANLYRAAHDGGIRVEALPPQILGEQYRSRAARLALDFTEGAAQQRPRANHGKEIRGYPRSNYALSTILRLHHADIRGIACYFLQQFRLGANIPIVQPGS